MQMYICIYKMSISRIVKHDCLESKFFYRIESSFIKLKITYYFKRNTIEQYRLNNFALLV